MFAQSLLIGGFSSIVDSDKISKLKSTEDGHKFGSMKPPYIHALLPSFSRVDTQTATMTCATRGFLIYYKNLKFINQSINNYFSFFYC